MDMYDNRLEELRERITILKAERDEAKHGADVTCLKLLNLLARIHRDGGHFSDHFGIDASLEKADQLMVSLYEVEELLEETLSIAEGLTSGMPSPTYQKPGEMKLAHIRDRLKNIRASAGL